MRYRRWIKRFFLLVIFAGLFVVAVNYLLRPSATERTEIFKGVFLAVDNLPRSDHGGGKVMTLEIHWDTPGVRLANREFSYPFSTNNPNSPHYKLVLPDLSLLVGGAAVLVNTTRYMPEAIWESYPGNPVRSVESVIVDGTPSHVHQHSYLMYWDSEMNAKLLASKPPDPESLEEAVLGIGLQGVQIYEGRARYHSIGNKEELFDRTFIGFDPDRKVLYLIAFEKASAYLMMEHALEVGVVYGGMLDSGSATTLLIGRGAKGLFPHSGIRNWRPLGAYLEVFAEPL